MSRYIIHGREPGTDVNFGVDHAGFIYVHYNEDLLEDGDYEEGEAWEENFFFKDHYNVLLAALTKIREVADVDDNLAAILREDFRMAIGQREYDADGVRWLTSQARKCEGVVTAQSGI
jgi:hypothetical protein